MGRALVLFVNHLKPGMVPAQDVTNPVTGHVVARAGIPLTEQALTLIGKIGIRQVAIGNPDEPVPGRTQVPTSPAEPPRLATPTEELQKYPATRLDPVVQAVMQRNTSLIKELDQSFLKTTKIDIQQVDQCVTRTLQEIVQNQEVLTYLSDLRVHDSDTIAHSTNVMSLSMVVGMTLGYSVDKLRVLGVGALLHDLGQKRIPQQILNKPSKLAPHEFSLVQTHAGHTLGLLKPYSWATREIQDIAQFHHERYDGSGYPHGLKGKDIPECAAIVALVDVYDALISRRSYRQPVAPHRVYQFLIENIGTLFAPRVVWAFQKYIVPYPANALVVLSSGQVARVLQVNRTNPMRPIVDLEGKILDLEQHHQLQVMDLHHTGMKLGTGPLRLPTGELR